MLKFILFISLAFMSYAQNSNITLLDSDYQNNGYEYNDIWGFNEKGKEYIMVGQDVGFAIYEVTHNNQLNLVVLNTQLPPGVSNTRIWGELRYYKGYIYKSTEQDQIQIFSVDLENGTSSYVKKVLTTAHNIFLYEDALYLCGGGVNGGGVSKYSLNDPLNPAFEWNFNDYYVHDFSIQDDKLYMAELYVSSFSVYDISNVSGDDLNSSYRILRHQYTGGFTHNIFPSPDGNYVVTTDEHNQFDHLQVWDISNPNNVVNKFKYREGTASIVHNAFIRGNHIYTSYYTKGTIVFDMSDPDNIVKTGRYDFNNNFDSNTFNEVWGVYPFLTGNVFAVSNIEQGLYLLSYDLLPSAGNLTFYLKDQNDNPLTDSLIILANRSDFKYKIENDSVKIKATIGDYSFRISRVGTETQVYNVNINENSNIIENFTLLPDATPPQVPSGLTSNESNGIITFKWNAIQDPDFKSYIIYDNNKLENLDPNPVYKIVSDRTDTMFQLTNFDYNFTYSYKISAIDFSGNESALSASTSIIVFDTISPVITSYIVYPSDPSISNYISIFFKSSEKLNEQNTSIIANKQFTTNGISFFNDDLDDFYVYDIILLDTGAYEFNMTTEDLAGNVKNYSESVSYYKRNKSLNVTKGHLSISAQDMISDLFIKPNNSAFDEADLIESYEFKSISKINQIRLQVSNNFDLKFYNSDLNKWEDFKTVFYDENLTVTLDKNYAVGVFNRNDDLTIPTTPFIARNYPNPFNPITTIEFTLPHDSRLDVVIYNSLGQQVNRVFSGIGKSGINKISWNGKDQRGQQVASGIYFYRITTEDQTFTNKMILLK